MVAIKEILSSLWDKQWFRYGAFATAGLAVGVVMSYSRVNTEIKNSSEMKSAYEEKIQQIEQQSIKQQTDMKSEYEKTVASMTVESSVREEKLLTKISKLSSENQQLKQRTKEDWVKIIHPDGTIEERKVTQTDIDSSKNSQTQVTEDVQVQVNNAVKKVQDEKTVEIEKITQANKVEIDSMKKVLSEKEQTIQKLQSSSSVTSRNLGVGLGLGYNSDQSFSAFAHYQIFGPLFVGSRVDMTKDFKFPRVGALLGVSF
jgi:hypothetical protein